MGVSMKTVSIISNNLECDELVGYFARLEKYFILNGWQSVKSLDADLYVIVACGAVDFVHDRVKNALNDISLKKGNFNSTVIMGCQPVTYEGKLKSIFDGKMINYGQESMLDELIDAEYTFESVSVPNIFNSPVNRKNELFTIIISTGCMMKCTYCVIKKAHGYITSKPVDEICEEFKHAVRLGYKNIAIGGTDTSVYGHDINTNFIALIKKLRAIDSTVKFYVDNLHPHNLLKYRDDFIELAGQNAFSYLHIAFQHIDDVMLDRMGRTAHFEQVYAMIGEMKKVCPKLILFTDFICAFPGETEEQYEKLLDFVKKDTIFDYYYIHDYCDIDGAVSYNYTDKISDDVKTERCQKLMIAFERRKDEKISLLDPEAYRIFKSRYDVESEADKDNPQGYYFCKNTYLEPALV